jgi:hypothetical protein
MIAWAPVVLAVLALIASLMDARQASRPARERADLEEDYDDDIHANAQAAATGDAATLSQHFEAERQAAIRRGDLEPAPPADAGPRS